MGGNKRTVICAYATPWHTGCAGDRKRRGGRNRSDLVDHATHQARRGFNVRPKSGRASFDRIRGQLTDNCSLDGSAATEACRVHWYFRFGQNFAPLPESPPTIAPDRPRCTPPAEVHRIGALRSPHEDGPRVTAANLWPVFQTETPAARD